MLIDLIDGVINGKLKNGNNNWEREREGDELLMFTN